MCPCSPESQPFPGLHQKKCGQQVEGSGPASLLCTGEASLEVLSRCPQYRRDVDLLECIQRRATKMMEGMEHLPSEDRLRELGPFILEKERFWGYLKAAFQYPKGDCKKGRGELLSRVCCYRTSGNDFKLQEGRFKLDKRKKFFLL